MLERSLIDTTFTQRGGSCVLASYAIVNKYFTSHPIEEAFQDYCRHFNVASTDWRDAEQKYAKHFDDEWKGRDCRGYQVILDLHNSSATASFTTGRSAFSATFYVESSPIVAQVEDILQSREAAINLSFQRPGMAGSHSVTVFAIPSAFCVRDTNHGGLQTITSLTNLGDLRDSVLYERKKTIASDPS